MCFLGDMSPGPGSHRRVPVIGITGQIGAGKSLVASLFAAWGGVVISGDQIGHEVVERSPRLQRQLRAAFGEGILRGRSIDRARLAERAFASPEATRQLNDLIHPLLLRELNRRIRHASRCPGVKAVVVDAALLAEWGRESVRLDKLVGIWAPLHLRRARLQRRGWSERQIRDRSRRQLSWNKRRVLCDCVVKNDAVRAVLRERARFCWEKILS
jgi:dephospho-CoA kinase